MTKFRIAILILVATVVVSALGCGIPSGLLLPVETPAPTPIPTPTSAPPLAPAIPEEPANALEAQIQAVYELARPAVVHISAISIAYDFFFRPVPQEGTGSGFLYDPEGHIITNYHVVENARELSVTLADGRVFPAAVVGEDPTNDLAVIRIETDDLPQPISLGDSDVLRVGQFVVAIGNPFGQVGTLTVGVISALGRIIESPDERFIGEAIQTDAAINPGNSGGPLLDLRGQLIGVNSQIISPSGASSGIGFAVPVNTVRRVAPQLIAHGRYPHPWLGVDYLPLTLEWTNALRRAGIDLATDEGLLVLQVASGSPADQAGIRGGDQVIRLGNYRVPVGGDVILAINGQPVTTSKEFVAYLETQTEVGDTVEVTLLRAGEEMTVQATLTERSS
ncbi:MAG TPA: PDZ domain-containing protein [Chloroflexi bacterium]|nr:PDZ domain-containing protein [Chloroflexota bacterium]